MSQCDRFGYWVASCRDKEPKATTRDPCSGWTQYNLKALSCWNDFFKVTNIKIWIVFVFCLDEYHQKQIPQPNGTHGKLVDQG